MNKAISKTQQDCFNDMLAIIADLMDMGGATKPGKVLSRDLMHAYRHQNHVIKTFIENPDDEAALTALSEEIADENTLLETETYVNAVVTALAGLFDGVREVQRERVLKTSS